MIDTKDLKTINQNVAMNGIIEKLHSNLLFDEIPILFIGKNFKNNTIIGISIDEVVHKNIYQWLHICVEGETLSHFINRKTSLLSIIQASKEMYLIEDRYQEKKRHVFSINLEQIPKKHLPLGDSFCPSLGVKHTDFIRNKFNNCGD